MLLRIIDQLSDAQTDAVNLILKTADEELSCTIAYGIEGPLSALSVDQRCEQLSRIIQLSTVCDEEVYEVRVESSRVAFFQVPWETWRLSGASEPLSVFASSFIRRFISEGSADYETECRYDLCAGKVSLALTPDGNTLTTGEKAGVDTQTSLRIVHWAAPEDNKQSGGASQAIKNGIESLRWGDAIDYELWFEPSLAALQQRLAKTDKPVHVLHYDGAVTLSDGIPYFGRKKGDNNLAGVAVKDLATLLVRHRVALLSVNACGYSDENSGNPINANLGLACVAYATKEAGLKNLLGAGEECTSWEGNLCFQRVYDWLASGYPLAKAIASARTRIWPEGEGMIARIEVPNADKPPLLSHYGGQSVYFFEQQQPSPQTISTVLFNGIHQRLFGFTSYYQPGGRMGCLDSGSLIEIVKARAQNRVLALTGRHGSGKTHTAHHAAFYSLKSGTADYAFCFDCTERFYDRRQVVQAISSVLDDKYQQGNDGDNAGNKEQEERVLSILADRKCYIVFDGLIEGTTPFRPEETDKAVDELCRFMEELASNDHCVIVTGTRRVNTSHFTSLDCHTIDIDPWSAGICQVFAGDILRRHQLGIKDNEEKYRQLMHHLAGNPFLMEKVLPQLKKVDIEALCQETEQRFNHVDNQVATFYEWQWQLLAPQWQRLLLLFIDYPGLLLEIPSLVCDRYCSSLEKDPETSALVDNQPVCRLLENIDTNHFKFSEVIELWQSAGFVIQHNCGRVFDTRARSFLRVSNGSPDSIMKAALAEIICQGVSLLIAHMKYQPNSTISSYLLINRRLWAEQLEILWNSGNYAGFMLNFAPLNELLCSSKLENEIYDWILEFLKKEIPAFDKDIDIEKSAVWFSLSLIALRKEPSPGSTLFSDAAASWCTWFEQRASQLLLDTSGLSTVPDNGLFHHVFLFLRGVYSSRKDWQTCRKISESACNAYKAHQSWNKWVVSMRSLAWSCFEQGDVQEGYEYESQLLETMPVEQFPDDYKSHLTFEMISARITRDDIWGAEQLLAEVKEIDTEGKFLAVIEHLQKEILDRINHKHKEIEPGHNE